MNRKRESGGQDRCVPFSARVKRRRVQQTLQLLSQPTAVSTSLLGNKHGNINLEENEPYSSSEATNNEDSSSENISIRSMDNAQVAITVSTSVSTSDEYTTHRMNNVMSYL